MTMDKIKKVISETMRDEKFRIEKETEINEGFQMVMVRSNKSKTKERVMLITIQKEA